jgi:hypothetical protein
MPGQMAKQQATKEQRTEAQGCRALIVGGAATRAREAPESGRDHGYAGDTIERAATRGYASGRGGPGCNVQLARTPMATSTGVNKSSMTFWAMKGISRSS